MITRIAGREVRLYPGTIALCHPCRTGPRVVQTGGTVILDDLWWPPLAIEVHKRVEHTPDGTREIEDEWCANIHPTTPDQEPYWEGRGGTPQEAVDRLWRHVPQDMRSRIIEYLDSDDYETTEKRELIDEGGRFV